MRQDARQRSKQPAAAPATKHIESIRHAFRTASFLLAMVVAFQGVIEIPGLRESVMRGTPAGREGGGREKEGMARQEASSSSRW